MENKSIKNIVMYYFYEDGIKQIRSCVFYNDGSIENGSYEDGINACEIVARERNITSKETMTNMINKDIFHVMSKEDFLNNVDNFRVIPVIEESIIKEVIEEKSEEENIEDNTPLLVRVVEESEENHDNDYYYQSRAAEDEFFDEDDDSYDEEIEDLDEEEEIIYEEDNFINNAGERLTRRNNLGIKICAGVLGLLVAGTIFACCHKKKEGQMKDSNLGTTTTTTTTTTTEDSEVYGPTLSTTENNDTSVIVYNNDLYNDYSFTELFNVTTNQAQRNAMFNLNTAITGFNGNFANAYVETTSFVKPALSFDEVVALQQAYNTYSIEDVRAYFNGAEIHAEDMSNAYKDASLQLMGAYVIETSENPVDMSYLIESQEGRDFYNRYHNMFLAAKNATGEEQLQLVNEFYQAVREDFPITEEIRTEGISHADSRNSIEDYQLAVTPMIAAAEMIFQDLEVDYTLDDTQIDFINDIGLCNHADDKFERIETIMLGAYEDNENPLYEQYRSAIIEELMNNDNYVIDDAHRELSNLQSFRRAVDGEDVLLGTTSIEYTEGVFTESTSTSTSTSEWEDSTTTAYTVTTISEGEITPEAQEEVDNGIDSENEEARRQAEEAAAEEARRLQEEADAEAARIQAEIDAENAQVQDSIDDINDVIDGNNSDTDTDNDRLINEDNYDGIDFDDDHSDENGNLDNSVQNITTDPSGADEALPNPEDTGIIFEARAAAASYNYSVEEEEVEVEVIAIEEEEEVIEATAVEEVVEETTTTTTEEEVYVSGTIIEYVDTTEGGAFIEYSDDYIPFDEDGNPIIIDENTEGYQYVR